MWYVHISKNIWFMWGAGIRCKAYGWEATRTCWQTRNWSSWAIHTHTHTQCKSYGWECNKKLLADEDLVLMGAPYFYSKLNAALGGNTSDFPSSYTGNPIDFWKPMSPPLTPHPTFIHSLSPHLFSLYPPQFISLPLPPSCLLYLLCISLHPPSSSPSFSYLFSNTLPNAF